MFKTHKATKRRLDRQHLIIHELLGPRRGRKLNRHQFLDDMVRLTGVGIATAERDFRELRRHEAMKAPRGKDYFIWGSVDAPYFDAGAA